MEGSVSELGAPCGSSRRPAGVGVEAQEAGSACRGAGLRGPGQSRARFGPQLTVLPAVGDLGVRSQGSVYSLTSGESHPSLTGLM